MMDMEHTLTDLNRLYEAFRTSMKSSAWKEEPQRFEIDFLSEIVRLKKELGSRTYETLPKTEFILNERGKTRCVHGGRMRDRVVRHSFCDNVLNPAFEPYLIRNNGASRKGMGLSFARREFERDLHNYWLEHRSNEGYIGLIDLSKFFDNIRHDKAMEIAEPRLDEFSIWLFRNILSTFRVDVSFMDDETYRRCMDERFDSVEYFKGVPKGIQTGGKWMGKSVDIGDQVSQSLGVFFPLRIDNYAKIVRGCKRYGRYMDDMYIIHESKEFVHSVVDGVRERAEELGLFVNERKTRVARLSSTFRYLGIRYFLSDSGKVVKRIDQRSVARERRKLKAYRRLLAGGRISYADVERAYKSWMGSFAPIMSRRQVMNMKQLFKKLFGKEPKWKRSKRAKR